MILSMVHAPCVIRNNFIKIESCSDKLYTNCWYSDFSNSGAEKSRHQGVVITSAAFTLTSVFTNIMRIHTTF